MSYIPSGVILIWPGTNASIPAGWQRETALDGRFPKGTAAAVNPNVTGGSATHSHTSPTHTHAAQAHRHYGQTSRNGDYETHGGASTNVARDAHVHNFDFTTTPIGGDLSDAITYQTTDNEPPYRKVIFIKPSGNWAALQDGIVALFNSATLPDDWDFTDGTNGTPDLRNRYLKGAGAGADSDVTTDFGSLTHTHTVNHTHTARSHTHQGTSGYDSDYGNRTKDTWSGGGSATDRHTHTIYLNASITESGSAYTGTVVSGTVEPLYKKLLAIQNNAGRVSQPRFIIGMWLGTLASIPFGWQLCDGNNGTPDMRGYHLKIANTTGEIGNTGGSNTHTHAASNSHTHTTGTSHNHTGYSSWQSSSGTTSANNDGVSKDHSHPSLTSCSSATSSWAATTISANSSNNEPPYRTVAFIQYYRAALGAAAMLL